MILKFLTQGKTLISLSGVQEISCMLIQLISYRSYHPVKYHFMGRHRAAKELTWTIQLLISFSTFSCHHQDLPLISGKTTLLFSHFINIFQILSPCDISFYGKTPQGQGAHMDISTSDLILNISPATIRTMSGIAAGLSKQEVGSVIFLHTLNPQIL